MYATVAKYSDNYVGDVINSLNGTNTIVFICGDHGAREVPIYENG